MQLETERLLIREFEYEDYEEVHAYASDPLVAKYMIWGPNTEAETKDYINMTMELQKQSPRRDYEFAVVLKATGQLMGGCGIHLSEPRQGRSAIALTLFSGKRDTRVKLLLRCSISDSVNLRCTGFTPPAGRTTPVQPKSCKKSACAMKVICGSICGIKADGMILFFILCLNMNINRIPEYSGA